MYPKTVMAQGIDVMWSHMDDVELLWTYCGATVELPWSYHGRRWELLWIQVGANFQKNSQNHVKNGENGPERDSRDIIRVKDGYRIVMGWL
jgi:hypothetical protein